MNREILFRGKRLDNNKWLYGSHFTDSGEDYIIPQNLLGINDYEECQVDQNTVGQFTGLRDKNGVKIFGGDIIKHPYVDPIFRDLVEMKDGEGVTSEVIFHDGAFVVKYDYDYLIYLDAFTRHGHAEVIGNIYDNPELLYTK